MTMRNWPNTAGFRSTPPLPIKANVKTFTKLGIACHKSFYQSIDREIPPEIVHQVHVRATDPVVTLEGGITLVEVKEVPIAFVWRAEQMANEELAVREYLTDF